ncbi:MAG: AAA family ATPase [Clostridia bacterium]|nr:AAA family ATPase [Clostridia bacterium]
MSIKVRFADNHEPLIASSQSYLSPVDPPPKVIPLNTDPKSKDKIELILAELEGLIGLGNVKKLIYEIRAFVEIQRKRASKGLIAQPTVLHMIFKGNPGTGKTTVARILGRLFKELGVLHKGHLIEIERADLVGEYIGQTAQKTREQVKRSLGGILFIDEAYSLARGGEKDFGKEAIDNLVKAMEDYKDNLILILAGYKEEMDFFLQTNPGLRSRFPIHIDFPDYQLHELMNIALMMFKERQYYLTPDAETKLALAIQKKIIFGHRYSGNARMVRNIVEKSIRQQAVRLMQHIELSTDDLVSIMADDLNFE